MDSNHELLALLEEVQRRAARKPFTQWYPDEGEFARDNYPKQMLFFEAGAKHRERCLMGGNRSGKAQPNDEPVLTPIGYVNMGAIKVGDSVVGSFGQPVTVMGVYPQGQRSVVRITGSDGSWTRCDEEHLWAVRPVSDGRLSKYIVLTARELARRVAAGERWMLPERPVVDFAQEVELPVDPYLVGALLGDGGLSTDTVLLSTIDQETIDYCEAIAPTYGCRFIKRGDCTYSFSTVVKRGGHHFNFLRDLLKGLGMAGKLSRDKRVPPEYLLAGKDARIALLRGLMDTDGFCGSNGVRCFYSVSEALCRDVAALARSLGINASVRVKNGKYNGDGHVSWKVGLGRSDLSVFNLKRKKEREIFTGRTARGVMVETVASDGIADCTCISVDAPDHLYLTRDYLVTHNTVAGAFETTLHFTGIYPDWWNGWRIDRPPRSYVSGKTTETTRDIVQAALLGGPSNFGGGMIPRHLIGDSAKRPNTNGAFDWVNIKHDTGQWGQIQFKTYEQGRLAFEGTERDWVWGDEEMPADIYSECLTRTATTNGRMILTFTPLDGVTEVVRSFMEDAEYRV